MAVEIDDTKILESVGGVQKNSLVNIMSCINDDDNEYNILKNLLIWIFLVLEIILRWIKELLQFWVQILHAWMQNLMNLVYLSRI